MEGKVKRCPNCNRILSRDWCMHCGYMANGKFIQKNSTTSISDVEIYLGDRFDKINQNKNAFWVFILGPLYFCYNRCLFCGLLFVPIEIFICYLLNILFGSIIIRPLFIFFVIRLIFSASFNSIYLWLCKFKVSLIKKRYKDRYIDVLRDMSRHTTSIIFLILGVVIVATVFIQIILFIRR